MEVVLTVLSTIMLELGTMKGSGNCCDDSSDKTDRAIRGHAHTTYLEEDPFWKRLKTLDTAVK